MNHFRPIEIGDYADITIESTTYRFYIVKIEPDLITIVEIHGNKKPQFLTKNAVGGWEINNNIAIFSKNTTSTRYLERDYTLAPTKIIPITDNKVHVRAAFTELKNGVIFYQYLEDTEGYFGFYDRVDNINFLNIDIFDPRVHYEIMNLDDEIFLSTRSSEFIEKFNLNDQSLSNYDRNPRYKFVSSLRDKKILCVLKDGSMYILDVAKKIKIDINIKLPASLNYSKLHQLSTGEILITESYYKFPDYSTLIYTININDNTLKISDINGAISTSGAIRVDQINDSNNILAILSDDKLLLSAYDVNGDSMRIQIYDPKNHKITEIYTFNNPEDQTLMSELLSNGDVLLWYIGDFYLFKYRDHTITPLPAFLEDLSNVRSFKQLKDGNLLINNNFDLSIIEFPLAQSAIDKLSYDEITPSISIIPLDMLTLIRNYI